MIEKLKHIHHMFYVGLIFMAFPFATILFGQIPYWHFFLALFFMVSYLGILITENKILTWLFWLYLLAYIGGNTFYIGTGFCWFYYYLSNILVYRFEVSNFRSPFLWTAFLSQLILLGALLFNRYMGENDWLFVLIICLFIAIMTFSMVRNRMMEELKADHAKQNAQINLLLAENERHRIGRDLHDSLGHTFAMLSVKADLADQFLALGQVEKAQEQVQEIQAISQESMHQVREIVENLKQRTLARELETVQQMLEVAQVKVEIQNELDTASISPTLESALAMVSLELATNMIKHAKATEAHLSYRSTETGVEMVAEDNGIGFAKVSDKDLHSIRERLELLGGELVISHCKNPTRIELTIPYQERK
ncbi:Sensor histidine kinase DesK [Streptococcus parasanguinis]|uniref:sensor histidine kinase n=1 Tax=Streptococcus parasanguinis TaxID=1318 RepID=UPI001960E754|nr:sensor histidine kinase [Streptococcus parasanguinis]VTY20086.1 Sensor histidine kinase DesK [Streptococcus parasanguinis]